MTLAAGDHLVIKRGGMIYTPDAGMMAHEFEVLDPGYGTTRLVFPDGTPCPTAGDWWKDKTEGVDFFTEQLIRVRTIR